MFKCTKNSQPKVNPDLPANNLQVVRNLNAVSRRYSKVQEVKLLFLLTAQIIICLSDLIRRSCCTYAE